MSVAILLQQILIIFLEIGTGIVITKIGIMDDKNSKFLSNLVMAVTLPCTLLASAGIDGGREAVAGMLKGYVVLEIFYSVCICLCLLLSRAMHLTRGQKAVLVGAAVMPNSAFIGIPLITALLGSEAGALYGAAGIMAYNILFFTYVQHLFDPEAKVSLKAFLTPTNITTAIMVVMLVSGLRLPGILESFCKAMGNTTTPLALIIAGGMLARSDLKKLVANPLVWLITGLRCLVFPLGFLAVLCLLPLDPTLRMAVLILASCPAGSLTAVLAKQYDTEGELASQAVAHSTLCILISVPLVLSLGSTLLGL
ncbi:AEC family transporter [Anaerostipes sp.]|uniref:AEC family transporter n=1 Tax=Anaerostipes sp. TaxID=1872530 RepID=UPI00258C33ED|nr:AEC family transporter [Anaerostipes sp.]